MSKTLYVGNLTWAITEQELSQAFEAHGKVIAARIITERGTGRSKGFGFVEVEDADSEKMVSSMNGFELSGRPLIVNEARPKSDRPEGRR